MADQNPPLASDALKNPGTPNTISENFQGTVQDVYVITKIQQKQIEKGVSDLKAMNNIVMAGFVVLLVMVGTLVIMVLTDWKNSNITLIEKVDTLQSELNKPWEK